MPEPSLTHVCMWTSHGWVHVTAEEATRLHPGGTVLAHSGLFYCSLCGQYVTLTDGEKVIRYFRHSTADADKYCPEKTQGTSYTPSFIPGAHELPLKLIVSNNDIEFKLGFVYVPASELSVCEKKTIEINISDGTRYSYSFGRLLEDSITYLSVGSIPTTSFTVNVDSRLNKYWPSNVSGINAAGTVFDVQSQKKVLDDSDVLVNKKYYILTKGEIRSSYDGAVIVKLILKKDFGFAIWYLYEVVALSTSEAAARFFLRYHCRLTDNPLKIQPLWPIFTETPYVIKHKDDEMCFYTSGGREITSKSFPEAGIVSQKTSKGVISRIKCNERQQIISSGSASVIFFTYLWKDSLDIKCGEPSIRIEDFDGNVLPQEEQTIIPRDKGIIIYAPYDGQILLSENGITTERLDYKANTRHSVSNISGGQKLRFYQGLDEIWSTVFVRRKAEGDNDCDGAYLNLLMSFCDERIRIPYSFVGVAEKLKKYPKTYSWLKKEYSKGTISKKAFKTLKKIVVDSFGDKEKLK